MTDFFTRCGAAALRMTAQVIDLGPHLAHFARGKRRNGMAQQGTIARGWTLEGFGSFWAKLDLSLIPRLHEISTNDIVGYWPRPIGVVRDSEQQLTRSPRVCPDLAPRLHLNTRVQATCISSAGWRRKPGATRILPDGRVCEKYISRDHPFFVEVVEYLRR